MTGTFHFNIGHGGDSFEFEGVAHLKDMLRQRFFAKNYNWRGGAISARLSTGTLIPLGAVELDSRA